MSAKSKTLLIAAALYGFLAIGLLAPFASEDQIPHANDMQNHLFLILEADRALHEGQFPIRTSPTQHAGWGYPEFQFYSSLPYVVGALIYRSAAFHNAYLALKMALWLSLLMAGLGLYLCAKQLGARSAPALVAGLSYMTAPYLLFNIVIRSHLTEIFAQGLFPLFMWAALRLYQAPTLQRALGVGALLFFLALTHHITFFYGIAFCMAFLFLYSCVRGNDLRRASIVGYVAVAAAVAWGVLMAAYIYAPIILYRYSIYITAFTNPFHQFYIPLPALLALGPVLIPNVLFSDFPPHFTPAAGLPFFIAFGYLLWKAGGVRAKQPADSSPLRTAWPALGGLFLLALFLAWSPVNFWQWLPRPFWFVQFPFRFLTYSAFFGALLMACALERLWPATEAKEERVLVAVAVLLMAAYPWIQVTEKQRPFNPAGEMALSSGLMAGYYDYLYCPHPFLTRSNDFRAADFRLEGFRQDISAPTPLNALVRAEPDPLPALNRLLERRDLYRIADPEGVVLPPNISALWRRLRDPQTASTVSLDELRKLNRTLLILRYPQAFSPLYLPRLEASPPLVRRALDWTVEQTAPSFKRDGAAQVGSLSLPRPALVQLPALNYPGLMSVHVDGEPTRGFSSYYEKQIKGEWIQCQLLTLQLPAGLHRIRIEFTGQRTANRVSAAAIALSLAMEAFVLFGAFRRRL